jgi:hypothetical protein
LEQCPSLPEQLSLSLLSQTYYFSLKKWLVVGGQCSEEASFELATSH